MTSNEEICVGLFLSPQGGSFPPEQNPQADHANNALAYQVSCELIMPHFYKLQLLKGDLEQVNLHSNVMYLAKIE